MSAEFVSHDELETLSDRLVGYVDTAVQKYVRESERRIRAETQSFREEIRQDLQAFRERHDVEMAQVHTEIGHIQSDLSDIKQALIWIAQRLPIEPIGPPPAQFLKYGDSEKA